MSTIIDTVKAMQFSPSFGSALSAYSALSEKRDWRSHFRANRKCWGTRINCCTFSPESD
jgi:hypothetical protein